MSPERPLKNQLPPIEQLPLPRFGVVEIGPPSFPGEITLPNCLSEGAIEAIKGLIPGFEWSATRIQIEDLGDNLFQPRLDNQRLDLLLAVGHLSRQTTDLGLRGSIKTTTQKAGLVLFCDFEILTEDDSRHLEIVGARRIAMYKKRYSAAANGLRVCYGNVVSVVRSGSNSELREKVRLAELQRRDADLRNIWGVSRILRTYSK